jgi:hypothetical protein
MALPPVLVGAVNVMVARVFPAVADKLVGVPGTVYGVAVTWLDGVPNVVEFAPLNTIA